MPNLIQKNILLAPRTTLGVGGVADFFSEVSSEDEVRNVVTWARAQNLPIRILGGGSNVLIGDDGVRGLVIHPHIRGCTYKEEKECTLVTVGAGVVLDSLVSELVEKELWGLENLSSIPGTVGGVPIQNVGAYGVEAKDIIESVEVYDMEHDVVSTLSNSACTFGYRDSLFKHEEGNRYIVLRVTFRVSTKPIPQLSYKDLGALRTGESPPRISEIRDTVIHIRKEKFPDWKNVGTAGSFFKNPIVTKDIYTRLQTEYPQLPGYDTEGGMIKLSLGWVLDRICNLRGYTEGGIRLYEKQALVLVCDHGISAEEIKTFVQKIIDRVFEKIGVAIEREVTEFK